MDIMEEFFVCYRLLQIYPWEQKRKSWSLTEILFSPNCCRMPWEATGNTHPHTHTHTHAHTVLVVQCTFFVTVDLITIEIHYIVIVDKSAISCAIAS